METILIWTNVLINNGSIWDALQNLYVFVGSKPNNEDLNSQLRNTEKNLSNLFEKVGKILETNGKIGEAIELYERSIWLDPTKSHLRMLIEQIR